MPLNDIFCKKICKLYDSWGFFKGKLCYNAIGRKTMDLMEVGKFLKERRKSLNLTQQQLANKLEVSEKTISKWECGNGFPDTTLMLPLCKALNISANELLSAKLLDDDCYKKCAEENLIFYKKQDEWKSKFLLNIEWFLMWFALIIFIGCFVLIDLATFATVWKVLLGVFGTLNMLCAAVVCFAIEKDAGYYVCRNCGHKNMPSFKQVSLAPHIGRTKLLKCEKCKKKTWQKLTTKKD